MSGGDRGRLEREQAFHDERFTGDDDRSGAKKYYSVTRASSARLDQVLDAIPAGARALELGCGLHNHAMPLAERGVEVCAIDISPVAVAEMGRRVADAGLAHLVTTQVMNAEELAFPADSFDLVVGTGILHHLDLSLVYPQLARVLRPGGVAAFVEPLGRNPLINLYRSLTPGMRTPDEHPLVESDFQLARLMVRRRFGLVLPHHGAAVGALPEHEVLPLDARSVRAAGQLLLRAAARNTPACLDLRDRAFVVVGSGSMTKLGPGTAAMRRERGSRCTAASWSRSSAWRLPLADHR